MEDQSKARQEWIAKILAEEEMWLSLTRQPAKKKVSRYRAARGESPEDFKI